MTEPAVSIGEAAALYGIAPSALRWWERQGVLDPPARDGGRRRYRDRDLRRIGLAYLCCVIGKMPLGRAAVVTSGTATCEDRQRTIGEQLALLEQRIAQLEAAAGYLRHLLCCADDDIARCPVLEGDLSTHTPRGRIAEGDLVTAARAAQALGDENPAARPRGDENPARCPGCLGPVAPSERGRPRKHCSPACRQRAYRARRGNPA
ncbi:DNA-binding transcriptional regulator, MerR family [Saccharopolyspora kobensis]|uniref:DNA-binding transcriptional regulator, MerR family n=1 Tax=Saccharopolyspora kobensis TaxID=146035 RepID=A0A1H6EL84_9PSEU|nr:MerR family transcriptional regulator [Saccharopolyspora kobensis]SEG97796.1 DNA-binding transcriptional regulator, MerR family [Saccharopolyspora kobensis]SFF24888.1 DNA-binding transcriptional regulator, MerR family [Saccharopolyspora kobensis]